MGEHLDLVRLAATRAADARRQPPPATGAARADEIMVPVLARMAAAELLPLSDAHVALLRSAFGGGGTALRSGGGEGGGEGGGGGGGEGGGSGWRLAETMTDPHGKCESTGHTMRAIEVA
jgi:uncharacterized membrane protein YgcG